ncbi:hypothetical protein G9A89_000378, partial [Geosiphon pyriformis]
MPKFARGALVAKYHGKLLGCQWRLKDRVHIWAYDAPLIKPAVIPAVIISRLDLFTAIEGPIAISNRYRGLEQYLTVKAEPTAKGWFRMVPMTRVLKDERYSALMRGPTIFNQISRALYTNHTKNPYQSLGSIKVLVNNVHETESTTKASANEGFLPLWGLWPYVRKSQK